MTMEDPDQPVDQPDAEGHQEEQEQATGMTMEDPDQPVDQPDAEGHQEEQEQATQMTVGDPDQPVDQPDAEGHQEEPGYDPVTPADQPELVGVKKESDSVKQEDDQPEDDLTADDLISQVATAGSVQGEAEPLVMLQPTQIRRNNLARYRIGEVGMDTFIDIFNVLSSVASRYVDSVGTFVRKLNLSEAPPRARELLGEHDPIFVFVDSEIEEATCSMAGDLSELRQRYPSPQGIDWLSFQYHLTLLQKDGPTGWDAPGFRQGGRIPMSVANICQNLITHEHFTHCHSTPFRDWQRVRHMSTLRRNPETRKNYAYEAVSALALYCQRAREANPQLEAAAMDDMMMMDYEEWFSQIETISEAIRARSSEPAVPDSEMEERDRQARANGLSLIQAIEDEEEARARRNQRKKDKKERRSQANTQPSEPTVILLEYNPPPEPSEEDTESVTRRIDFDQGSQAASVREPETPEELHRQPNRPSSPRGISPPPDMQDADQKPNSSPADVDAPERVEDQNQQTGGDDQAEQEPEQPPPEGDHPAGDEQQDNGEAQDSSKQPPDPPEPPQDPDDPDNPDQPPDPEEEEEEQQEEDQEEAEEEDQEEPEEGQGEEEEEEEKEEDPLQLVESESTKKSRKIKERKEKIDMAALARLPYPLSDKGPLYKGTMIDAKDNPQASRVWRPRKGSPTQVKDKTPISHVDNRAFVNIRDHQISSIFTLQKHLVDCNKGARERHSTPEPLSTNTGEYSPCQTKMATTQSDDGTWSYVYSELPGLVSMKCGMKTFHIIEQVPFNTPPTGPHRNLVRQIIEELEVNVKSKTTKQKATDFIDELPSELNPESIRAARVLIHDISNHQYVGLVDRGLEYYPSVLTLSGNMPVSDVDASGDWIHLASLVEQIKGIKQRNFDDLPFYLRGLIRMVPLKHLHQILLYASLTESKANIQIGVDSSAYIWVRAVQFHGTTFLHQDANRKPIPFHLDGTLYKDKPIITALFSYAEVVEAFAQQDPTVYPQESVENFIFPLDRYADAYTAPDICSSNDQVLALQIKVQTAQRFGMIILPSPNGLVITSGVPVNSIVGARDHRGRHLDVQSLATLEWKIVDNGREQSPCTRGKCYLPSLELCHTYRLLTEHVDGSKDITSLPTFDPSKLKELRAPRSPDANGIHQDMMYCEFKGCTIMVYGMVAKTPIGTNRFPGWTNVSKPARSFLSKGKGDGRSPSKGKGKTKGNKKGKGKGDQDDTPSREDRSKFDPIGPCEAPAVWKDKEYDDIPMVQEARPADHCVEAYLQGTSDIPTFRVVWITSMGVMPRSKLVSPNRFGDPNLWKTPEEDPDFWKPCQSDQGYTTLSPGEDDCCRMCPNTDAEELIPCAWCKSWAHYRCTYAVGPGRACASHFKVLNPLDKIVVARGDDPVVPAIQRGRQVFPNCCHPRVSDKMKPTPSNVQYTTEAYWVYKHAWRGVGAYYQKGDHVQKKTTGNAPVEFKALKMFPDWERWITPRPTFLSDQLLNEATALEKGGEAKNRVRSHNVFEHYHDGLQPHSLPNPPVVIQSFKEYKNRSQLDPRKGNLWGCFWDACTTKEKGFWEAALLHNSIYSLIDDSKIYHPINFGEEHPDYRPRGDDMPSDRPRDNDQRFCYHTTVKVWKTSQVHEERTLQMATDKAREWRQPPQNIDTDPNVVFHLLRWKQIKRLLLPRHLERELGRDNLLYLRVRILPRLNKRRRWPMKKGKRVEKGRGEHLPFTSKHWQLLQGH